MTGFAAARRCAARRPPARWPSRGSSPSASRRAPSPRCCSPPRWRSSSRAFPMRDRGRALAAFFGITGALTAVGPLAGGYLTEWTWRAIFWINVPVALAAVILTIFAKPAEERRPRGSTTARRARHRGHGARRTRPPAGRDLGLDDLGTTGSIVAGAAPARRVRRPRAASTRSRWSVMRLFGERAFAVDNLVLLLMSAVFVPFFFFASVYAQASLGDTATQAGAPARVLRRASPSAAQLGGRIVDSRGARPSVVAGCLRRGGRLPALGIEGHRARLRPAVVSRS